MGPGPRAARRKRVSLSGVRRRHVSCSATVGFGEVVVDFDLIELKDPPTSALLRRHCDHFAYHWRPECGPNFHLFPTAEGHGDGDRWEARRRYGKSCNTHWKTSEDCLPVVISLQRQTHLIVLID